MRTVPATRAGRSPIARCGAFAGMNYGDVAVEKAPIVVAPQAVATRQAEYAVAVVSVAVNEPGKRDRERSQLFLTSLRDVR
ncbi:hypothetical protein [Planotetraspora silvatica]|nr:hypothetical protein [Planotetraspora silvatica]